MEPFDTDKQCGTEAFRKPKVFRVIDDSERVLTTMDPYKALVAIQSLIEKYDITHCWVEMEPLE